MRIVEINTVNKGSTGTIMRSLAKEARSRGHEVLVCFPDSRENRDKTELGDYVIGTRLFRNLGKMVYKYLKADYVIHFFSTYAFIVRLKRFNPDIVHIHNVHNPFLNLPLFFRYLKNNQIKVVFTLHDCWLYTGHCTHYIFYGCTKWQTRCNNCPYYKFYPESAYDDSSYRFQLKKKILLSLGEQLTLTVVSKWLAGEVSKSYLKGKRCEIIPNGIDERIFHPNADTSVIRAKFNLPSGKLYMAAATCWGENKGLPDYYKLANLLRKDEHIVLIGLSEREITTLPSSIIGIKRTDSQPELAMLYSVADVILSLSRAETFGLTIIEANACGIPVVAYDNTAQSELIINGANGFLANNDSVSSVRDCLDKLSQLDKSSVALRCIDNASNFRRSDSYDAYIGLMESLAQHALSQEPNIQ